MSRKERLQLEAAEALKAFEASQNQSQDNSIDDSPDDGDYLAPVQRDDSAELRRELEAARAEAARLARERDEFARERDTFTSSLKERETAAEKASREAAEMRAELQRIREEKELELSDEDLAGIDPEVAPMLKKLIEKQSRAITKLETARLREEMENSFMQRAKTEVLAEVDSRQYRSTFDSRLRADGDEDVYDVINGDDFQQFVKGDDLRLMAFTSAASTKDEASARVIKRLVKDFKEKAVKKPASTPRTGARLATVPTESEDDVGQIDHAQIMRMVKSSDPAEKKRGRELLDKAAARMSAKLSSNRQPVYS